MMEANKKCDMVLLSLIVISGMLIYLTNGNSPSRFFISGTYGIPHFAIDWTTLSVFTFSVLFYSHRCFVESTKSVFKWMKWQTNTRYCRLAVFVQVVSVTLTYFLTAVETVFGRVIEAGMDAKTVKAMFAIRLFFLTVAALTAVPTCLYLWLKLTGRDKQLNQDENDKTFGRKLDF